MSQPYHLAQLNIAKKKAPLESPEMADFVNNLERINTLAEQAPGFVWRLKDESGNATALANPFGDEMIVNMSVWQSVDALREYAFKSAHVEIMRRRREWFERMDEAYAVLWWVPSGTNQLCTKPPNGWRTCGSLARVRRRLLSKICFPNLSYKKHFTTESAENTEISFVFSVFSVV